MIQSILNVLPILAEAAVQTIELSLLSIAGAVVLGFLLAELSLHSGRAGAVAVRILAQIVRGMPVLVFVFLVYYLLPVFGIRVDKFVTAVVSLSIFFSFFFAEVFRSAIASIPAGQRQSALALGMSRWEIERIVILPQALRIALAPSMNLTAIIVKATSIVSIIGVWELTYAANEIVTRTMQPFTFFLTAMAFYFCICFSLVYAGHRLGQRLNFSYKES